jgi:hypothetical protein
MVIVSKTDAESVIEFAAEMLVLYAPEAYRLPSGFPIDHPCRHTTTTQELPNRKRRMSTCIDSGRCSGSGGSSSGKPVRPEPPVSPSHGRRDRVKPRFGTVHIGPVRQTVIIVKAEPIDSSSSLTDTSSSDTEKSLQDVPEAADTVNPSCHVGSKTVVKYVPVRIGTRIRMTFQFSRVPEFVRIGTRLLFLEDRGYSATGKQPGLKMVGEVKNVLKRCTNATR